MNKYARWLKDSLNTLPLAFHDSAAMPNDGYFARLGLAVAREIQQMEEQLLAALPPPKDFMGRLKHLNVIHHQAEQSIMNAHLAEEDAKRRPEHAYEISDDSNAS